MSEKKDYEVVIDDYKCYFCGNKFRARSGILDNSGDKKKNKIHCPKCDNGLKNKL